VHFTGLVLLLWTVFGLMATFQMYANTGDARWMFPWSRVFHLAFVNAMLKGFLTIPLLWGLRLVPFRPERWKQRVLLYVALLPVFVALHVAIRPFVVPFVVSGRPKDATYPYPEKLKIGFRSFFIDDAWGFCCFLLAFHAYLYAEQASTRAVEKERLDAQLAQAELQALKVQIHPHFLFNTLNTIYNLVPIDGRKSQAMVAQLSNLLRTALDYARSDCVPLETELRFLELYLSIEKTRFEDRLHASLDIAPDTLRAEVPYLLLQPLVENSIRDGIGKKAAGGTVSISAHKQHDRLLLSVTDDGAS